ncbi:MAG TPA: hypothetical protein V6C72_16980 [Chroococcales cyanobacterium]
MSHLDDKANSYLEKFASGFIFFAILGMVVLLGAVFMLSQAFNSAFK